MTRYIQNMYTSSPLYSEPLLSRNSLTGYGSCPQSEAIDIGLLGYGAGLGWCRLGAEEGGGAGVAQ